MKKTNEVLIKIWRVNGMFFLFFLFFVFFFLNQFGLHAAGRRYCYISGTYGPLLFPLHQNNIQELLRWFNSLVQNDHSL